MQIRKSWKSFVNIEANTHTHTDTIQERMNRLETNHTQYTSIFIFYFKNFAYLLTFIPQRQYWNIHIFSSLNHLSTGKKILKRTQERRRVRENRYQRQNCTIYTETTCRLTLHKLLHFVITLAFFNDFLSSRFLARFLWLLCHSQHMYLCVEHRWDEFFPSFFQGRENIYSSFIYRDFSRVRFFLLAQWFLSIFQYAY